MELEWLDEGDSPRGIGAATKKRAKTPSGLLQKGKALFQRLWNSLGPPEETRGRSSPPKGRRDRPFASEDFPQEDEIDLYEYYLVIRKRLRPLLLFAMGTAFGTGLVSLFLIPKVYEAKATILPIEGAEGSLVSALNTLGGLAGIPLAQKQTSSQTLVAVLESISLAEGVISRLDLMKEFFKGDWDLAKGNWKNPDKAPPLEDGIRKLKSMVSIQQDRKTGVVTIKVEYTDPRLAAAIANTYVEELDRFINKNALSMAKRQRIFLEGQVEGTKKELQEAEERLKAFQEEKRLVVIDAQAQAAVKGVAELKALITAKEVELDVVRTYATAQNPRVQLLESELKELRKQLQKLEAEESARGGSELSLASAPDLGLTYTRLQREVMYRAKLLELLYQQYEMAKIQEAKEDIRFQLIDPAVPPVRKAKPRVSLNVALSTFLALILGIFWAFFAEYLEKVKSRRWETLESAQPSETSTLAPLEDEEGERQRKAIGSSVNESKGRKARKAAGG
jgi:uncharacterized protein involved in exopolysaccharide biosynthesis